MGGIASWASVFHKRRGHRLDPHFAAFFFVAGSGKLHCVGMRRTGTRGRGDSELDKQIIDVVW